MPRLSWPEWVSLCHLIWPSFDADLLRTGGLRALGLTLSRSAKVFKLPDMTAWGGVFQGSLRCFDLTKIVTLRVFFQQKQNGKFTNPKWKVFRGMPPIRTAERWPSAVRASVPLQNLLFPPGDNQRNIKDAANSTASSTGPVCFPVSIFAMYGVLTFTSLPVAPV